MIVEKNFLAKLKEFGLNSYESKLWTALLSRGISTAGELSDIANVPRSRTYDVLESLEKKGFIIMKIGKPIKYLAVDPSEVVKRVQKNIELEADTKIKQVNELKDSEILQELSLLHNQGIEFVNPSDLTGSFRGRDNNYIHLDTMFKSAEKTITIITTEKGFIRKIEYFENTLRKAISRGVKVRICSDKIPADKLAEFELDGIEFKEISEVKSRLIVVDSKEVMFMLMDDTDVHPSYDSGVWVNSPFFAQALESLFELAWKEMKVLN